MSSKNKTPNTNSEQGAVGHLRVLSELMTRAKLASQMGISFSGARDLYEVLGYKREPQFSDYYESYRRGRLGKRIINAPVQSTWHGEVSVFENEAPNETPFEKAWKELNEKLKLTSKLQKLDSISGIGRFAVLFMGFDDGLSPEHPLEGGNRTLLYVQSYHEGNATITSWEADITNPRYGLPVLYSLKFSIPGSTTAAKDTQVHYSRILHIAEGTLENEVYGTPRLEDVYNGVMDLEKIVGGSAEMFWQGALGGKAFSAKEGATLDVQSKEAMQTEIDEWIHGMRRYMRLQNMDVQDLAPSLSDPKNYVDVQLDLISGATGIPKRILIGSERGELASSQDETNWLSRIKERRVQYVAPFILRPFIDKLIAVGALPEPAEGYQIFWPDLWSASAKEKAEVAKLVTEALAAYMNAPGIDQVMPFEFYLEEIVGLSEEQIERIQTMLTDNPPEEPLDEEKDLTGNMNPNHDPENGQFTSGPGGSGDNNFTGPHHKVIEFVNDIPMYHYTSMENKKLIEETGFKVSSNSMYGEGVYFTNGALNREAKLSVDLKSHKQLIIDEDIHVPNVISQITGVSSHAVSSGHGRQALLNKGIGSVRFKMDNEVYTVVLNPSLIQIKRE